MSDINPRLVRYLDDHSSIVKLTAAHNGEIVQANVFAEKLAGRTLQGTHLKDFFTDFNAMLDFDKLLKDETSKAMLNVNTFSDLPETFYFTSFKIPEGIILIGELDHKETEDMRNTMISLNNELNNLTRELQKKNVQLDQLNKLKNQFLGMAAHDLRNPIASIIMFSEFVLESDNYQISDDLRQILDVIRTSSEFMLNLLEELLDVVKIESGKLELNYEEVQPEDFLKRNISVNALIASKKGIKITLNIPEALPQIMVDSTKIEQVLNNLLSNAIKYSHSNTTITISAFSSEQHLLISVQDEGLGIPQNELHKVFDPFSKISVKGTAGEKSTGLGLSIVKRIVTGHLGRIWVESEVGKGSTFYFTLPLKNQPESTLPPITKST
jgi:signal transduction histidine kinase